VRRRVRAKGIDVDPARVREARLEAGLSLAGLAGDDISRTMVHFIEHGKSRPSRRVLEMIATRTGKPVGYFLAKGASSSLSSDGGAAVQISAAALEVGRLARNPRVRKSEREALKLVELVLRQAARVVTSVASGFAA